MQDGVPSKQLDCSGEKYFIDLAELIQRNSNLRMEFVQGQ